MAVGILRWLPPLALAFRSITYAAFSEIGEGSGDAGAHSLMLESIPAPVSLQLGQQSTNLISQVRLQCRPFKDLSSKFVHHGGESP